MTKLDIPAGWWPCPTDGGPQIIMTRMANGLLLSFSIEHYKHPVHRGGRHRCGPMELTGTFRRLVISRKTMYPTWDEMRECIKHCGLFDRTRDVAMVIPPDGEYVNFHPNAFHWWQREEP